MPLTRQFSDSASLLTPSRDFFAITKSDTVDLAFSPRSIRVGAAGDVVAVREDGVAVTFKSCAIGEILPIIAIRINATGTTANDLVGM